LRQRQQDRDARASEDTRDSRVGPVTSEGQERSGGVSGGGGHNDEWVLKSCHKYIDVKTGGRRHFLKVMRQPNASREYLGKIVEHEAYVAVNDVHIQSTYGIPQEQLLAVVAEPATAGKSAQV